MNNNNYADTQFSNSIKLVFVLLLLSLFFKSKIVNHMSVKSTTTPAKCSCYQPRQHSVHVINHASTVSVLSTTPAQCPCYQPRHAAQCPCYQRLREHRVSVVIVFVKPKSFAKPFLPVHMGFRYSFFTPKIVENLVTLSL